MGFYYRKSVGLGPFRVKVGKSGLGLSVGTKGFRTGVSARGHRYSAFGVPGTGLGYRTEHKGARLPDSAIAARTAGLVCGSVERIGCLANGTVVLLRDPGWKDADIPVLLQSLDEDFLPDVDLERGSLSYTVVVGEVLGNWEAIVGND